MGSGASAPRNTGTTDSKARTALALRPTSERIKVREVAALRAYALRDDDDRDARSDVDEDATPDGLLRRVYARVAGCARRLCCFGSRPSGEEDTSAAVDLGACCLWSRRDDLLGGRPPDAETGGFVEDRHGTVYVEVGSVVRVLKDEHVDGEFTVVKRYSGRYQLQPVSDNDDDDAVVHLQVSSDNVRSYFQVLDVPDDADEPEDEGDEGNQMRSMIGIVNDESQWYKWRMELALTEQAIARGENPPPPPKFDMQDLTYWPRPVLAQDVGREIRRSASVNASRAARQGRFASFRDLLPMPVADAASATGRAFNAPVRTIVPVLLQGVAAAATSGPGDGASISDAFSLGGAVVCAAAGGIGAGVAYQRRAAERRRANEGATDEQDPESVDEEPVVESDEEPVASASPAVEETSDPLDRFELSLPVPALAGLERYDDHTTYRTLFADAWLPACQDPRLPDAEFMEAMIQVFRLFFLDPAWINVNGRDKDPWGTMKNALSRAPCAVAVHHALEQDRLDRPVALSNVDEVELQCGVNTDLLLYLQDLVLQLVIKRLLARDHTTDMETDSDEPPIDLTVVDTTVSGDKRSVRDFLTKFLELPVHLRISRRTTFERGGGIDKPIRWRRNHSTSAGRDAIKELREWADERADRLFANAASGFGDGPSFDEDVEYLLAHQRFQPEDDDARESHAKYVRWLSHRDHLSARERRQEALASVFEVVAEAIAEEGDSGLDE